MIQLEHVSRHFVGPGGESAGLQDISFVVPGSQLVALVGRSGSGKSTLLNVIGGIDHATAGRVVVCGTDIGGQTEAELTVWRGANVGFVFQFFQLIPTLTVQENVRLPMDFLARVQPGDRRRRALDLLAKFDVDAHEDMLPGILSGGEQQRVAIARALANDPPVLLADEPTGNLDSTSGSVVIELLQSLAREGKTVVVATHDPAIAKVADRTLELSDGKLVGDSLNRAHVKK